MQRSDEPADNAVTTWKTRQAEAHTLRVIGAYLNLKQEDVMSLFGDVFQAKLKELQQAGTSKSTATRKV